MPCTPAPPLFWYDPANLPVGATPVTSWLDSSGNGYNLTAPAGLEPVGDAEAIPGAVFTAGDKLEGSTDVTLNFANGYTIFVVMKEPTSASRTIMGKVNAVTVSGWDLGRYDVGFDNLAIFNSDYNNPNLFYLDRQLQCYPGAFDTSLHIYMIQMYREGAVGSLRMTVRRDGASTDSTRGPGDNQHSPPTMPVATNEGAAVDWGKFTIGDVYNTLTGFTGTIKLVMGYAGKLADVDVALTEDYLRNRFSIQEPQNTYSTPTEVGRVSYANTWSGIGAAPGSIAGDVEVMMIRYKAGSADIIDFANTLSGQPWVSTLPTLDTDIPDTVSGGQVGIRFAYRVCQGALETSSFQNNVGATAPVNPHLITIVAYRGLALGAAAAPYQGNSIGPYGFFYQDESTNFEWTGFAYQPNVDYSSDPVFAAYPNSMLYQLSVLDTLSPTITSTVLAEGATAQITGGSGPSWLLQNFVFQPVVTPAAPLGVPSCGDTVTWDLPALEWSATGTVTPASGPASPTMRFDAGVGSLWYVIPQLSDSGNELRSKTVKDPYVIGRTTNGAVRGYRFDVGQEIDVQAMEDDERLNGASRSLSIPDKSHVTQSPMRKMNLSNAVMHTIRVSGDDTGQTVRDRIDQITYQIAQQGVRR